MNTVERKMKIYRTIHITNTLGEYDGCRLNPDSSSGIYMPEVKGARFCIVAKNMRKQDEVKFVLIRANYFKRASRIIK